MKVTDYKENEDGTATITVDMTEKETQFLVEYAIVNLLKEYIDKNEPIDEGE